MKTIITEKPMPHPQKHLDFLNLHLSNERIRLSQATTDKEKAIRKAWVKQIEKEIKGELKFLGIKECSDSITDDELMKELMK
jgi:hypothetical protein